MTKATQTAVFLGVLFGLWVLLYLGVIPTNETFRTEVVPVLPFWSLVAFGAYALATLGYDVLTFNDKPEKYQELMGQIAEAKADLQSRGVSVE